MKEDVLCVCKTVFRFFINSLLEIFHRPFGAVAAFVPAAVNYAFCADINPRTQLPCLS